MAVARTGAIDDVLETTTAEQEITEALAQRQYKEIGETGRYVRETRDSVELFSMNTGTDNAYYIKLEDRQELGDFLHAQNQCPINRTNPITRAVFGGLTGIAFGAIMSNYMHQAEIGTPQLYIALTTLCMVAGSLFGDRIGTDSLEREEESIHAFNTKYQHRISYGNKAIRNAVGYLPTEL